MGRPIVHNGIPVNLDDGVDESMLDQDSSCDAVDGQAMYEAELANAGEEVQR